jgi:hypothetical protein
VRRWCEDGREYFFAKRDGLYKQDEENQSGARTEAFSAQVAYFDPRSLIR